MFELAKRLKWVFILIVNITTFLVFLQYMELVDKPMLRMTVLLSVSIKYFLQTDTNIEYTYFFCGWIASLIFFYYIKYLYYYSIILLLNFLKIIDSERFRTSNHFKIHKKRYCIVYLVIYGFINAFLWFICSVFILYSIDINYYEQEEFSDKFWNILINYPNQLDWVEFDERVIYINFDLGILILNKTVNNLKQYLS